VELLSSVTDAVEIQDLLSLEFIMLVGSRPAVWGLLDGRE
jgi:hypothetical protein